MIGWTILAAAFCLLICGLIARIRTEHYRIRESYREDLFKAASALVENDATPQEIINIVEFMGETVNRRLVVWRLLHILITGRLVRIVSRPGGATFIDALSRMEPPMKEVAFRAVGAYVLALTYNSLIIGWLLRRLALYRVHKSSKNHYDGSDDAGIVVSALAAV